MKPRYPIVSRYAVQGKLRGRTYVLQRSNVAATGVWMNVAAADTMEEASELWDRYRAENRLWHRTRGLRLLLLRTDGDYTAISTT